MGAFELMLGKVYTGRELNKWLDYHTMNTTEHTVDAYIMLSAYGHLYPHYEYLVCSTSDYPKSDPKNGNRDGRYMLRRVGIKNRGSRNIHKRRRLNWKSGFETLYSK